MSERSTTSAEVRFTRKLASNDERTRRRALKALQTWLEARSQRKDGDPPWKHHTGFSELEMLKVWKGLYVCMWHSDKPLVQEELAEEIAGLLHVFHQKQSALLFLESFYLTMAREWHGIDRLRLDKFYTLIRRIVHHSFQLLKSGGWKGSLVQGVTKVYAEGVLCPTSAQTCSGVQLHVVEVYLPELLLVGGEEIPGDCTLSLLRPCLTLLARTRDATVAETVSTNVFEAITRGTKAIRLQVDLGLLSEQMLQAAIDRETVGANRKTLYSLRRRFAESAGLRESVDVEETEVQSPAKSSPKQRPSKRKTTSVESSVKKLKTSLKHRSERPKASASPEVAESSPKQRLLKRKRLSSRHKTN